MRQRLPIHIIVYITILQQNKQHLRKPDKTLIRQGIRVNRFSQIKETIDGLENRYPVMLVCY